MPETKPLFARNVNVAVKRAAAWQPVKSITTAVVPVCPTPIVPSCRGNAAAFLITGVQLLPAVCAKVKLDTCTPLVIAGPLSSKVNRPSYRCESRFALPTHQRIGCGRAAVSSVGNDPRLLARNVGARWREWRDAASTCPFCQRAVRNGDPGLVAFGRRPVARDLCRGSRQRARRAGLGEDRYRRSAPDGCARRCVRAAVDNVFSLHGEGIQRLEDAVLKIRQNTSAADAARLWLWLGMVSRFASPGRSLAAFEQAVVLCQSHGSTVELSHARVRWARSLASAGQIERAKLELAEAWPTLEDCRLPKLLAFYFSASRNNANACSKYARAMTRSPASVAL